MNQYEEALADVHVAAHHLFEIDCFLEVRQEESCATLNALDLAAVLNDVDVR